MKEQQKKLSSDGSFLKRNLIFDNIHFTTITSTSGKNNPTKKLLEK